MNKVFNRGDEVIRAEGLGKTYAEGRMQTPVFDGLDLTVTAGETVAIIGASGAGKSTLLHLLGGLDTPTAGEVYVTGQRMSALSDTSRGLLLGLVVAVNIDVIVPALEHLLNASFLPKDVYLISKMPSDPQANDIVPIAVISLILAFVATIYPSWRASRVNPAEALRYE